MLPLVPVLCFGVDAIRRELIDDEQRCEACELRDSLVERIDVMEHAPGDDCVVRAVDLLEARAAEARAFGRVRVDAEHVVAGGGERRDEPALVAAADLEHSRWRRWQLRPART